MDRTVHIVCAFDGHAGTNLGRAAGRDLLPPEVDALVLIHLEVLRPHSVTTHGALTQVQGSLSCKKQRPPRAPQ